MTSIQSIRTFESLLGYLGDVLQWPVSSNEIEDMTYEYHPAELGITGEAAVNITNIVRIRPFHSKQPWSVFYIEFASGNLPVVVLRRVLNNLIVRQRATKSDHQRWNMHDLLFISSHGAATDRHVTFAHFAEAPDGTQLPTLRVLGWDGDDSKLRMQDVEQRLQKYFMFPADDAGVVAWPQTWNAAFTLRPNETIKTTKQLSVALARLARDIRDRLKTVMSYETESGQYAKLMASFKSALIHDLVSDDFADMYAQTIAYGLLSTRIANPTQKSTQDFAANLQTNPFLRELMQTFLTMGGRDSRMHVDFDELGINEIIDLLNAAQMDEVLLDFNNRNAQEDPVIHFYELFLKEYDAKKRMQRGVFYTPKPVVGYIVRSVHELLQRDFGLADGLADTTTWADMLASGRVERLPLRDVLSGSGTETINSKTPFVQILDPATGTGTFLVEVIDVIHRTMLAKWSTKRPAEQKTLWNDYVEQHLLPRVFGYELMMAPYAIAHLKIGLKLAETGYTFNGTQRANVYLTNALEPGQAQLALSGIIPALAHEAAAVNTVKLATRFTVVVGNPPYSQSSQNFNPWINKLMETYKTTIRSTEPQISAVSDDYVKFTRLAQHLTSSSQCSVIGLITNNGFIEGRLFRDMRNSLLKSFQNVSTLNLHGSGRRGDTSSSDQNVFDILQGVSIMFASCSRDAKKHTTHAEIQGTREHKYALLESDKLTYIPLYPEGPMYLFVPSQDKAFPQNSWSLERIFGTTNPTKDRNTTYSGGCSTRQDSFSVAFTQIQLHENINELSNHQNTEIELRKKFGLCSTAHFDFESARLAAISGKLSNSIMMMRYRPFDDRPVIWAREVFCEPQTEVSKHLLLNNLCLLSSRVNTDGDYRHAFVSRGPVDKISISNSGSTNAYMFPLYLYNDSSNIRDKKVNLNNEFLHKLSFYLKLPSNFITQGQSTFSELDVFQFLYAQLHSNNYRTIYRSNLMRDFPKLLFPDSLSLFEKLSKLGEQLVALHLMESPLLDTPITTPVGSNWIVGKVGYADGTVWIDGGGTKAAYVRGTTGFTGVPEEVWNFHIGGYKVCEKWLKDRKGRTLSDDDIAHYQKIVVALKETIRLMAEIDVVIEEHGGWPGAFASGVETSSEPARPQFGQSTSNGTPKRRAAEDSLPLNFADDE
jgi:predicted helicase